MRIIIAKTAGFCMGVRRAVEMVLDTARQQGSPIFTYGPLIHNPQVLSLFKEKGISAKQTIPEKGSGPIIIRAHGVPPESKDTLKSAGFDVIDATCPRVIKVQTIIQKHAKEGYVPIIIGDRNHPEVIGLLGYAGKDGYVANNLHDLMNLPEFEKAIIVAQTTQNSLFFKDVKDWAARTFPHYKVFDTICDSTEKRQAEVIRIAEIVDAIIVVGGYNSGNTKRLVEIAQETGKLVYHIETESELDMKALASFDTIGITAGASTPNWIIKKVYRKLEGISSKGPFSWRKAIYFLQRSLLLTNIFVAFGAGALCYACSKLQNVESFYPQVLIAALYVQSMHILNHLMGRQEDRYNDPERAEFYINNRWLLSILATVAGATGLLFAYHLGIAAFLILLTMSILGFSYNLRLIPPWFSFQPKYKKIRDIPGSKTVLIAVAWGIVTSILPSIGASNTVNTAAILAFFWASSMVFVRTAFFEVLDIQGDRIVGKETIPILFGEKQTLKILKLLLVFSAMILILASILGLFKNLGFILALSPALMYSALFVSEKGYMLPGIHLEFLIESNFVLAGIMAFGWSLLG